MSFYYTYTRVPTIPGGLEEFACKSRGVTITKVDRGIKRLADAMTAKIMTGKTPLMTTHHPLSGQTCSRILYLMHAYVQYSARMNAILPMYVGNGHANRDSFLFQRPNRLNVLYLDGQQ